MTIALMFLLQLNHKRQECARNCLEFHVERTADNSLKKTQPDKTSHRIRCTPIDTAAFGATRKGMVALHTDRASSATAAGSTEFTEDRPGGELSVAWYACAYNNLNVANQVDCMTSCATIDHHLVDRVVHNTFQGSKIHVARLSRDNHSSSSAIDSKSRMSSASCSIWSSDRLFSRVAVESSTLPKRRTRSLDTTL